MAYRRSKRYGRRRAIRRRSMRAGMRRRAPISLSLKRYIRRAVARPQERKIKSEINDAANYNGAATATGDVIPMLPIVQIGDTSYARDGRSIMAKSCTLTLTVKWLGVNLAEAPLVVTVWHVRDKQQKSFQAVADNGNTGSYPYDLFACLLNQINVPIAPVGAWQEAGLPLNSKRFVVKRRTFKLSPDGALFGSGAPGFNAGGTGSDDPQAGLMRTLRFRAMLPRGGKVLTYRTDGDNYPTNHNEYCFITYTRPTTPAGSTGLSSSQLTVTQARRLIYTDA